MRTLFFILGLSFFTYSPTKAQCSEDLLESYGGMSVIAMYNTYISIGAIADGYTAEKYDAAYVQDLMNEQIAMLTTVSDMLTKVVENNNNNVDISDKNFMSGILIAFDYLKLEAESLKEYCNTNSTDASALYDTNRQLAWDKISELMGLE